MSSVLWGRRCFLGIADWVRITKAMFKSYQNRFKEWNCTIQVSRSLFVTFVLETNWIINLPVLRWLSESLQSWNWFIPMLGVQWKLPLWVDIGMLWASLTATVASLVLFSWNISQKSWKNFASFVLMKVYLRHSRLWRWGLMVEASMITKLLMSFVLRKALSEKRLLLIPRIRMVLLSVVGKLLETLLGFLLKQANLPNSFWVRAVDVAFYLTNRCLSGSMPPNKTPFELVFSCKPDLSNLKVFGCSAFRFLEVGVKKLDSKVVKETFVGYGRTHDSYYLYNPVTGKISHSRNVSFNEKEFLGFGSSFPEDCEFLPEPKSSLDVEEEQVVPSKPLKPVVENDDSRTQETSPVPESPTSNSDPDLYADCRTRSGRHSKTVELYGCPIDNFENVSFVECFSCEAVPNSLEEVKRSQSRDEWLEAMTKVFNSIVDNTTWELCELPAHKIL